MRDYCEKCPMFWNERDYWGEWDESCELNLDGWFNGKDYKIICRLPHFIKRIYQKYRRWKEERYWKRYEKQYEEEMENEEYIKCSCGMTQREKDAFIAGVEMGIDWNLVMLPEEIELYHQLTEERKLHQCNEENNETNMAAVPGRKG